MKKQLKWATLRLTDTNYCGFLVVCFVVLDWVEFNGEQFYAFLYDQLNALKISSYFIVGYIVTLEIIGVSSITIDFIIEDVIKSKKKLLKSKI